MLATLLGLGGAALAQASAGNTILFSPVEGEIITPVIAGFLKDGVERARAEQHTAYLIQLDTPGGLDTSMRDIIRAFLDSPVPVIVYIPAGGRAASAGALIGFSANVLAMAPGTSIGAATPVDLQGGDISRKIINDAAAFAEDVARARGRNAAFARETVTEGRAESSHEALRLKAIDVIAADRDALLEQLDGREVTTTVGTLTLQTAGAALVPHEMSFLRRAQQRLADPNLAFIFMSIGTLAIIYELANPGIGAGGIVGVILILLALFSLSVLPVNTVGALLMLLAAILFVGEVLTPGVGVFAAGGSAALVLGGLFLFRGSVGVSLSLLLPTAIVVGSLVVFAGRLAWRARRAPSPVGAGGAIGHIFEVKRVDGTTAQAFVEGAWWRVRSRSGEQLSLGQSVQVVGAEGLELIVEPAAETAAQEG